MSKRKNEVTLKEAIAQLIAAYKIKPQFNEAKIIACWEEIMGKTIANRTRYVFAKNGVLYLSIQSAPLKQELFFAKDKIIELVNRKLGEVYIKEIVFR